MIRLIYETQEKANGVAGEMTVEQLFNMWRGEITGALIRFSSDSEAAEDACSEAFVKALKNEELLETMPEQAARAWLHSAARNSLIDAKRREKKIAPLDPVEEMTDKADEDSDFTGGIVAEEILRELPEYFRNLVKLRYLEGYNATEIGGMLGLNPATVRTQLRAAVTLMKRNMFKPEIKKSGGKRNG